MSPQPLGGDGDAAEEPCQKTSETLVYYASPINGIEGPILIQTPNMHKRTVSRKFTAGGIIYIHGKLFALTVAHVFADDPVDENRSTGDGDLELSLEDEDEGDMWDSRRDDEFVDTTSRGKCPATDHSYAHGSFLSGSQSPEQHQSEDSESSCISNSKSIALDNSRPLAAPCRRPSSTKASRQIKSTLKKEMEMLEVLGPLSKISIATDTHNLDWALVEITSPEILALHSQRLPFSRVKNTIDTLPQQSSSITVITPSNGKTIGIITTNPTFMQLPTSIAFQEVWTVQLDGPLGMS
jgi:hypothetical protein